VLLAVCTLPPWPARDGYSLRVGNILRELAARWSIVLVSPEGEVPGLTEHIPVRLSGPGLTYPWRFDGAPLREALARAVARHRPDRALVWPGAEALWFGARELPPAVMDMIDCNPLEFWRGAWSAPGVGGSLRERARNLSEVGVAALYARRTVRSFAATLCVGGQDAAWMARIGGRGSVHVVPNGVALPDAAGIPAEAERPTLSFTGTLDYAPNVDAVRFAARRIWPRVLREVSEARFVIAGRRPVGEIAALDGRDGIAVETEVPEMAAVLGRCWVSLAPMRTGVGIKNKVLEAWACGRPVVMTPLATNGLVLPPGHAGLVSAGAAGLAAAAVALLRDEAGRRRLGLAAREHVARHCGWAAAAARVDELLRSA
jgi:glycosyltransferase involved in cell wall biosynthesis